MLNVTQELSNKIADGNHWIVHDDTQVIEVFASRDAARAAKGDHKVKKWDGEEGFNRTNGHDVDMNIDPVAALQAVGLQPQFIDENTDFPPPAIRHQPDGSPAQNRMWKMSRRPTNPTSAPATNRHPIRHSTNRIMGTWKMPRNLAIDKEAEVEVKDLKTMSNIPKKEAKVKPVLIHKSTAEKPTRLVHSIADLMAEENPDVTRKEILQACTEAGIAHYTILTQYQAWRANRGN